MPGTRSQGNAVATSATPYPSWSSIAGDLGCHATPPQEIQAVKEARLWRALAEEPLADEQAGKGDGGRRRGGSDLV